MDIEVVLLLYNRPHHSRQVLESLVANKVQRVHVYLDFADRPEVASNQKVILETLDSSRGIEIELTRRTQKLGLARSVRSALDEAFTRSPAALLLEDDCVLEPGGFEFFQRGLEILEDRKDIRSLCGFLLPNCDFVFDPGDDILLLQRFCPWGWATWADRWREYTADLAGIVERFRQANLPIREYAEDIAQLCASSRYLRGEVDIWSIGWILLHFLTSSYAAYPREAVITNIGMDGSGANCEDNTAFRHVNRVSGPNTYNWKSLHYFVENDLLAKAYMADHGLKTYPAP